MFYICHEGVVLCYGQIFALVIVDNDQGFRTITTIEGRIELIAPFHFHA